MSNLITVLKQQHSQPVSISGLANTKVSRTGKMKGIVITSGFLYALMVLKVSLIFDPMKGHGGSFGAEGRCFESHWPPCRDLGQVLHSYLPV